MLLICFQWKLFGKLEILKMDEKGRQQKVKEDAKLCLKYDIIAKIGSGSFGTVYKAINKLSRKNVAIKIQFVVSDCDRSNLIHQITVLTRLKGIQGIPEVYEFGRWRWGYFIEMELLSSCLYDQIGRQFTQSQINFLMIECIHILRKIHAKGIIHSDLKPQNLMRNFDGSVILIDFGLSSIVTNQSFPSLNADKIKHKRGFVGTPRYASICAHQGEEQNPKDDLQSLMYVVAYIWKKKIPWLDIRAPAGQKLNKIVKIKKIMSFTFMRECSPLFLSAYQYIMNLSKDDKIDYLYLINIFHKSRQTVIMDKSQFLQKFRLRRWSDQKILVGNRRCQKKDVQAPKYTILDISQSRQELNFSILPQYNSNDVYKLITEQILDVNNSILKEGEQNKQQISEQEGQIKIHPPLNFKNPFIDRQK